MKKSKAILVIAPFFFTLCLSAQENLLKAGAVAQGFANHGREYTGLNLGFESRISRHFTFGLDIDYFHSREAVSSMPGVEDIRNVWNVQPEFKFYLREALQGFFLGGHLGYNKFNYRYEQDGRAVELAGDTGPSSLVATGFTLGYRHTVIGRIKMGFFAGGDYFFNPGRYGDGAKFRFGVNLGYGF